MSRIQRQQQQQQPKDTFFRVNISFIIMLFIDKYRLHRFAGCVQQYQDYE